MALIFKDRVKETTTTTGQGTVTLLGNVDGFRSFADIGDANTTYYCIFDNSANTFEIGIGTYTASGTTLSRDTVLQTSSGNTTKINFASGNKEVFCVYPAGKAVYLDENGDLTINGVKHLNAISNRWTKTATSNQTVFTGNSDDSTTLSVGEHTQVFLNGIMLKKTTDYALSNNDTITLTSGASANDILESITFAPFTVASALQPSNNLSDVSSASTALSNLGGMSSSGGTFTGNVSLGSNDLSTTGKILFANMYATEGDLPSASQQHGMLAHVHNYNSTGVGRAVFAHGGNWIPLANHSELSSYLLSSAVSTYGATLIDDADAPTARTTLGLGTMAVETASDYLTTSSASSTYLTQSNASSTYLTQSSASSTYLTQSNASSTYLTQSSASSTYAPLSGATFTGDIIAPNLDFSGNSGKIYFGGGTDDYLQLQDVGTSGNVFALVQDNNTKLSMQGTSGNATFSGAIFSNTFYDSNNTSYYVDPASTSLLNYANVGSEFQAGTTSTLNSRGQIAIYRSSNPYISFHNGTLDRTAYMQENGSAFLFGEVTHTETVGSFRAPIFFDSGNTGYYVDPASTSNLYTILGINYVQTPIVYDYNNSSYYSDPSSTSSLYNVHVHNQLYLNTNTTLSSAGTVGTAGQVLTSNGNSRPTWQDASGGGNWEVVSEANIGSVNSFNISVAQDYYYRIILMDLYTDYPYGDLRANISCLNSSGTAQNMRSWRSKTQETGSSITSGTTSSTTMGSLTYQNTIPRINNSERADIIEIDWTQSSANSSSTDYFVWRSRAWGSYVQTDIMYHICHGRGNTSDVITHLNINNGGYTGTNSVFVNGRYKVLRIGY